MSCSEFACHAVDLLTATMNASRLVEYAVFGKNLVDGSAPTRGIVFAENVCEIAG